MGVISGWSRLWQATCDICFGWLAWGWDDIEFNLAFDPIETCVKMTDAECKCKMNDAGFLQLKAIYEAVSEVRSCILSCEKD